MKQGKLDTTNTSSVSMGQEEDVKIETKKQLKVTFVGSWLC